MLNMKGDKGGDQPTGNYDHLNLEELKKLRDDKEALLRLLGMVRDKIRTENEMLQLGVKLTRMKD